VLQAAEMLRGLNLPVVRNLVGERNGGQDPTGAPGVTVIDTDATAREVEARRLE
jgi:hypothetical protein